ncbi:hypothetical protein [Candidatus Villigracilis affinis]|uniref:hypothetical protein n=1 Tax=Candidatus Villigracilis affinis TaxID=3140682 RepID=UPI002A1B344B|nr:hypothetical protein [Anaerolineales bacterium]
MLFLPPEYLRDEFAARGTALTLPIIGMIMIYFRITNENIARIIFSVTGLVISLVIVLLFNFWQTSRGSNQRLQHWQTDLRFFCTS